MRQIDVTAYGEPEVLEVREAPDAVATAERPVLVRMAATVVNPVDVNARRGYLAARTPDIRLPFRLGFEVAGTVESDAAGFRRGERVVGMIPWLALGDGVGSNAEIVPVAAEWLAPLPEAMDWATAATLPLNALAARQGLDNLAGYADARSVLVAGASGAVGAFAARMAVRDGHEVIALASTGDEDHVRSLGVSRVIPRGSLAEIDAAVRETAPEGVDAVFDAAVIDGLILVVCDGGSFGVAMDHRQPEPERGIRVTSVHSRPDRDQLTEIVRLVGDGELSTRIDRVLPIDRVVEAHRAVEAGGLRGRVVLIFE